MKSDLTPKNQFIKIYDDLFDHLTKAETLSFIALHPTFRDEFSKDIHQSYFAILNDLLQTSLQKIDQLKCYLLKE